MAQSPLVGILVTPEQVTLPRGQTGQVRATGLREDRSTDDLTAVVTWATSPPVVASVSQGFDAEGVITGVGVGQAKVTAAFEGVLSPEVPLTVTQAGTGGVLGRYARGRVGPGAVDHSRRGRRHAPGRMVC